MWCCAVVDGSAKCSQADLMAYASSAYASGKRQDVEFKRVAYHFAAYRHYLKYQVDDNGDAFEVADPWLTVDDRKAIDSDDALEFLGISAFTSTDLKAAPHFVELYLKMVEDIKAKGAMKVLEEEIL